MDQVQFDQLLVASNECLASFLLIPVKTSWMWYMVFYNSISVFTQISNLLQRVHSPDCYQKYQCCGTAKMFCCGI